MTDTGKYPHGEPPEHVDLDTEDLEGELLVPTPVMPKWLMNLMAFILFAGVAAIFLAFVVLIVSSLLSLAF